MDLNLQLPASLHHLVHSELEPQRMPSKHLRGHFVAPAPHVTTTVGFSGIFYTS